MHAPITGARARRTPTGCLNRSPDDRAVSVDRPAQGVFYGNVAERFASGRRVLIEDARENGTFLRVTWHPESRMVVVSHWRDDICLAATRVPVEASADVIAL